MSYVYFIQAGTLRGPIKVGIAKDPDRRMGTLQVGNAQRLTLLATVSVNDPQKLESVLHRSFAQTRGEWFQASAELREFIGYVRRGQFRTAQQFLEIVGGDTVPDRLFEDLDPYSPDARVLGNSGTPRPNMRRQS